MSRLILASSSPYRRALLERLRLPFEVSVSGIDEQQLVDEPPDALAARLAAAKARAVASPDSLVIGSDQVASLHGSVLRKPATRERAVQQLLACSGQTVDFYTAVMVVSEVRALKTLDHTTVVFRNLSRSAVERYVELELPLDCAGGFKAEGLGVTLFERIESADPTALIGLPLIWLSGALRQLGMDPLTSATG